MNEHTKGKIKFDGYDGHGGLCIWDEELNHIITVVGIGVGKEELKRQKVLVEHLVKCWNAFEEGGLVDDLLAACEESQKAFMLLRECNLDVKIALGSALQMKKAQKLNAQAIAKAKL